MDMDHPIHSYARVIACYPHGGQGKNEEKFVLYNKKQTATKWRLVHIFILKLF